MNNIENAKNNIKVVEDFINHNLKMNYINKNDSIQDLLIHIENIKKNYFPTLEKIIENNKEEK